MDNEMNQEPELERREQDSKKVIVIVVITILLGVNVLLLWQFFDKKNNLEEVTKTLETTISEKDALSAELQRMKTEYEKVNQENASLQSQLSSKDEEIKSKITEIQRLINSGDAAQLKRAREELAILKALNSNYVTQIDSLNRITKELNDQNLSLNSSLTDVKGKVDNLMQENSVLSNKVAIGSILKTMEVKVVGVKFKSSGKEIESTKSGGIHKIKTCFKILENLVVDKGPKEVYLRVLSPDGAVMSNSTETFLYNGQPSLYTTKEGIDYQNRDTDVCIYWAKGSPYTKGKYTVEIYCEGNQIGTTSLTLK